VNHPGSTDADRPAKKIEEFLVLRIPFRRMESRRTQQVKKPAQELLGLHQTRTFGLHDWGMALHDHRPHQVTIDPMNVPHREPL
jgi:hypothetical protein